MSEWWTYTLTDFLLFSPRTYYRLFELYNAAVWPAQIVTLALGLAILVTAMRGAAWSGRVVAASLAVLWSFVAWAYLLERYDTINWAGRYFAIGFVVQAALLAWTGIIRDRLRFDPSPLIPGQAGIRSPSRRRGTGPRVPAFRLRQGFGGLRSIPVEATWRRRVAGTSGVMWLGLALFLYALIIHPLVAPLAGRPWTQAEIFGLAPDPTVLATLGILLAADHPRWHLLAIPLLWCLLSGLTLWTMQSPEALVIPCLATVAVVIAAWKRVTHRT